VVGRGALLYQEDKKFKYILPSEGAHMFIDSLAIPANAPNPEAAMLFMNYILRPEVSKQISVDFPYTNPTSRRASCSRRKSSTTRRAIPPGSPKLDTFRDIGDSAVQIDKVVTDMKAAGLRSSLLVIGQVRTPH
jgi:spermidine/putrescine transport system substrate-binding protein